MEKDKTRKNKKSIPDIWRNRLKEYTDILGGFTKKIRDILSEYTRKAMVNTDTQKLKTYTKCAVYAVFGFLMSVTSLPQNIKPLGISAVCANSDKNSVLFTYIGAALGCITYGNEALSSFIIYFMLYAVRKTFTDSLFSEGINVKMLEAAAVSAVVGIIRICTAAEAAIYSYVAFLTSTCISVSYTYFFSVLFDKREYAAAKLSTVSICSYALVAAIVCSFDGVYVAGFDIQLIVSCFITLSYAVINGFLHAGSIGFICGIASASPIISACLGLSGLVSSFLLSKSVIASAVSFAAVFFSVSAYSAGLNTALYLMPSVICGCVLFFPLCGILPVSFRLNTKASKIAETTCEYAPLKKDNNLSAAFFSISDMFSRLAEKQKYPSYSEIETIVDKTFSEVCAGCALSEMCYAKRKTDMDELKQTLFAVLDKRPVGKEDYGTNMNDKCIRLESHIDLVNRYYRELVTAKASDNRTFLMGAQYAGMARLTENADKASADENVRDTVFEKKLAAALKDAGIPFMRVCTFSEREKITAVHGISLDRIPFGANELKKYLYSKLGVRITEPSFDISEKSDYVMSFSRANAIRFEYAQYTDSKNGESVSGDTVNLMHSKNGYFRALICDGMGSGRDAALSSRLASLFLEKMLDTDTEKGVMLELLGNALMSRSGESFSTVDLFEADLLTGKAEFVKAGAAPTYVLRKGKIYKIFSATPPVGIISGFTSEITRFKVEAGDVIIMVSDGAVPNNEDSAILAELVKTDISKDPSAIASEIAEMTGQLNERTDDVSICVIKAFQETL